MTFSILGRNPINGELGIAIATYSLAVGGSCPGILSGVGVVTSQAATIPAISRIIIEHLKNGLKLDDALGKAITSDLYP